MRYKKLIIIFASSLFINLSNASSLINFFPRTTINIGIHVLQIELANTSEQREQGLMFRKNLAQNEGMLFDFHSPAKICMWMKNTLIPLSVAFANEEGEIINIENMQPQTLTPHCSEKPARFALEVNQGWFQQKGIQPSIRIDKLPHK